MERYLACKFIIKIPRPNLKASTVSLQEVLHRSKKFFRLEYNFDLPWAKLSLILLHTRHHFSLQLILRIPKREKIDG